MRFDHAVVHPVALAPARGRIRGCDPGIRSLLHDGERRPRSWEAGPHDRHREPNRQLPARGPPDPGAALLPVPRAGRGGPQGAAPSGPEGPGPEPAPWEARDRAGRSLRLARLGTDHGPRGHRADAARWEGPAPHGKTD